MDMLDRENYPSLLGPLGLFMPLAKLWPFIKTLSMLSHMCRWEISILVYMKPNLQLIFSGPVNGLPYSNLVIK